MEWMPSNMAPWQSQQYSVLHTRTILPLSLSLCLSLSTLSINCGCSGDPNATVNTDNDKPSARNHKQQMWNKMEKTGSVRMFVPLRNGCFLALLINFWRTGHSSFSFFFLFFFFYYHYWIELGEMFMTQLIEGLFFEKLHINLTNDLQVSTAFTTTASRLVFWVR